MAFYKHIVKQNKLILKLEGLGFSRLNNLIHQVRCVPGGGGLLKYDLGRDVPLRLKK